MRAERTRKFVSEACGTQEMRVYSGQKSLKTKTIVKSGGYLAGAPGLEPGNGGIKIRPGSLI